MKPLGREPRVESRGREESAETARSRPRASSFDLRLSRRAFTLIEVMVVVAIMGIILAVGAPSLYRLFHKEGFRKTLSDLTEVCSAARARAIMRGVTTEVVFHPVEKRCEVSGGEGGHTGGLAHSAQIGDDVDLQMLDVNQREYKDAEVARVRFFPNGTSDEMTLILQRADGKQYEQWGIVLEITTGLATVLNETQLQELRNGKL